MLNYLQGDIKELLDLVRETATFDATVAASQNYGQPIMLTSEAQAERHRKGVRIVELQAKWHI